MVSPLGPTLDNMVKLDIPVLFCLASTLNNWSELVDATIGFKKAPLKDPIYHWSWERRQNTILIYPNNIKAAVCWKSINNNIYIDWKYWMPNQYKMRTLRTLDKKANDICSTDEFLENELNHIKQASLSGRSMKSE